jgi:Multicopper oxidase
MTIIEVDGENVQPLVVDSLVIFAGTRSSYPLVFELIDAEIGQRYSVVVRPFFILISE